MIVFRGSGQTGAQAWYLQRITGILLVFLLVGHFLFQHFGLEEPEAGQLTYSVVTKRLANPMWKCLEIAFLVVALYHSLNGIWMVAADYVHNAQLRVGIFTLLWIAGLFLLVIGVITLLPAGGTV